MTKDGLSKNLQVFRDDMAEICRQEWDTIKRFRNVTLTDTPDRVDHLVVNLFEIPLIVAHRWIAYCLTIGAVVALGLFIGSI